MREPIEWKSEVWWRNRPLEERLSWLHIPKRIETELDATPSLRRTFLDEFAPGKNLYITGQGANGKSLLAAQMLRNLVIDHPVSGRWIEADTYIQMLKDSFDNSDGLLGVEYSSPYTIKNVRGVFDVLVIDGLGDERKTDFAAHEMGNLIRTRYDRLKTTIVTSRLSISDVTSRYGDRLSAPLSEFEYEVVSKRAGQRHS